MSEKYVYHELVTDTQCEHITKFKVLMYYSCNYEFIVETV